MNDQDKAVAVYLTEQGIAYTAALRGETTRDDWKCDEWAVTFTRDGHSLDERFFTGTGHRKADQPAPDYVRINPRSLATEEWTRRHVKPVSPTAASVLYSVLLDAEGAGQSFHDWCSDYGYDTDSRKALDTYEACSRVRGKVNLFFTAEQREQLRTMLEDY